MTCSGKRSSWSKWVNYSIEKLMLQAFQCTNTLENWSRNANLWLFESLDFFKNCERWSGYSQHIWLFNRIRSISPQSLWTELGAAWSSGTSLRLLTERSWVRGPARTARFGPWEIPFALLFSLYPDKIRDWIKLGRTCNRLTSCPRGVEILSATSGR